VAKAEIRRAGSQLIVIGCDVVDDDGHLVALADFSMMLVPRRDPLPGMEQGGAGS
jgi:acyl-coenzyme A thioesterase PaaI-like protein